MKLVTLGLGFRMLSLERSRFRMWSRGSQELQIRALVGPPSSRDQVGCQRSLPGFLKCFFFTFVEYIWLLARPNIAKRGP